MTIEAAAGGTSVRNLVMHSVYRYSREAGLSTAQLDGYPNYHFITTPQDRTLPRLLLEAGINSPEKVSAPDGMRRPAVSIRSSPWKAGQSSTPWHDEFDLDHGHVRYYGDHKPGTHGLPGATRGNRLLLESMQHHGSATKEQRLFAPPLLLYRSVSVRREGRAIPKGHIEFCGVAVVERLEHVIQRDPQSNLSFPNLVLDLAVLDLAGQGDQLDFRWIDDRRDPSLSAGEANRYAPKAWLRWVELGAPAIPQVRRRVQSARIRSRGEQLPSPGTVDHQVLWDVYKYFDGKKHAFEMLASRIAAAALGRDGGKYVDGWLTPAGGDGGMDFVGRLDVGPPSASAPLVVLGQAKCTDPSSPINADQLARVAARLRRGWLGVYVTTGWFTRQAQVEMVDDEYPIVLISGRQVAEFVRQLADTTHGGDVGALLKSAVADYANAVTHRRPEEVLAI
jgi:hypothetical protein